VAPIDAPFPRYQYRRGSVDVTEGLFSAIRITRPGTDEVLVDVTSTQFAEALAKATADYEAQPGAEFTSEGWTLTGNPMVGPLTAVTSDGERVTFAEVRVYEPDDQGPGLEAVVEGQGRLVMMRNGERVWEAQLARVQRALTDRVRTVAHLRTWVFHSPEAGNWTVVLSNAPDMSGIGYSSGVDVGDDELLVNDRRIPIDEDD
jgi:hypothetical protein